MIAVQTLLDAVNYNGLSAEDKVEISTWNETYATWDSEYPLYYFMWLGLTDEEKAIINVKLAPYNKSIANVPLAAGGKGTNIDLLTACGEGDTWALIADELRAMPFINSDPEPVIDPGV